MTLRYTRYPHGREPTLPKFPSHARPIASAPTQTTRPVVVFEADGKQHQAIYHRGQWQKIERTYDPYSGRTQVTTTGQRIGQPVLWTSS